MKQVEMSRRTSLFMSYPAEILQTMFCGMQGILKRVFNSQANVPRAMHSWKQLNGVSHQSVGALPAGNTSITAGMSFTGAVAGICAGK